MCNASGNIPRLTIQADVRKNMDSLEVYSLYPYKLDLDKDRPEDQKHAYEYEFSLKNLSEQELMFSIVSQPGEHIEIDFQENKSIAPGKEQTFKVKFDDVITDDVFAKSFTIEASDEQQTRVTVPFVKAMRWGPAPTSQR